MSPFYWMAVATTIVISSARLTRLATYDKFPPVKALRDRYFDFTDRTERRRGWQILAFCAYCASYWPTLLVVVTGDLCGVYDGKAITNSPLWAEGWWLFFGTLAASYLAAIFTVHDGDPDDSAAPASDNSGEF